MSKQVFWHLWVKEFLNKFISSCVLNAVHVKCCIGHVVMQLETQQILQPCSYILLIDIKNHVDMHNRDGCGHGIRSHTTALSM